MINTLDYCLEIPMFVHAFRSTKENYRSKSFLARRQIQGYWQTFNSAEITQFRPFLYSTEIEAYYTVLRIFNYVKNDS